MLLDATVDGYIATGRLKHNEEVPAAPRGRIPNDATPKQRMARKLRTKKGKAVYARRKVIPEPVFGQMKTLQGAGQLLLRGHDAARAEWMLHATVHNLRKLATHRDKLPPTSRGAFEAPPRSSTTLVRPSADSSKPSPPHRHSHEPHRKHDHRRRAAHPAPSRRYRRKLLGAADHRDRTARRAAWPARGASRYGLAPAPLQ
jgi:hypothetical protein